MQVVVVDFVAERGLANLIQPFEPVETDRESVRHDQAMEHHGEALLADALHFLGFSEDPCPRGNEDVLAVARIDIICE